MECLRKRDVWGTVEQPNCVWRHAETRMIQGKRPNRAHPALPHVALSLGRKIMYISSGRHGAPKSRLPALPHPKSQGTEAVRVGVVSCSVATSVTKAVLHAGDVISGAISAPGTVMKRRLSFEVRTTRRHANLSAVVPRRKACPGRLLPAKRPVSRGLRGDSWVQMIRLTFPRQRSPALTSLHHTLGPRPFLEPVGPRRRIKRSPSSSSDMSCTRATMDLRRAFSNIFLACSKRSNPKGDWLCAGLFGQLPTLTFPTIRATHSSGKRRCSAMG